jgi:hypothetical protein
VAGTDAGKSAAGTAAAMAAGLFGGPPAAAVVGFVLGLRGAALWGPAVAVVGVACWLKPELGVYLAVIVAVAVLGFVFGALRRPPAWMGSTRLAALETELLALREQNKLLSLAMAARKASVPAGRPVLHVVPEPPAIGGSALVEGPVPTFSETAGKLNVPRR